MRRSNKEIEAQERACRECKALRAELRESQADLRKSEADYSEQSKEFRRLIELTGTSGKELDKANERIDALIAALTARGQHETA